MFPFEACWKNYRKMCLYFFLLVIFFIVVIIVLYIMKKTERENMEKDKMEQM